MNMSTKQNVIIAVIAIILIAASIIFLISKNKSAVLESTVSNKEIPGPANSPISESTNLKSLFAKGLTQSCTFSTDSTSGTVYVASGKMRGDFSTNANGQTQASHIIITDSTSYVWSDGQNVGFKMNFDPNTVANNESNSNSANSASSVADTHYNYNCSNWSADSNKFVLPSNVTFSTFAMPAGNSPSSATGSGQSGQTNSQCSYCNNLTGDQKSQCLAALNCN